jgi:hypothetical protein
VTQLLPLAGIVLGTVVAKGVLAAERGPANVPAGAGLQSNHIGGFDSDIFDRAPAASLQSIAIDRSKIIRTVDMFDTDSSSSGPPGAVATSVDARQSAAVKDPVPARGLLP